jgi:hypothetical protein
MSHTITARQYIALRLYYVEGWNYSRIGEAFGVTKQAVHQVVMRGRHWIIQACGVQGVDATPRLRVLLAPSPTLSPTRNVGVATSRQDELLDALELRMEQQASMADSLSECMSGDSFRSTHVKRNSFDQWELRYAMLNNCLQLPTSAYNARVAQRYCGMDVDAVRY